MPYGEYAPEEVIRNLKGHGRKTSRKRLSINSKKIDQKEVLQKKPESKKEIVGMLKKLLPSYRAAQDKELFTKETAVSIGIDEKYMKVRK